MVFRITMRFNEWVICKNQTIENPLVFLREFIVCNERLSSDELCSLSFLQQKQSDSEINRYIMLFTKNENDDIMIAARDNSIIDITSSVYDDYIDALEVA